MYFLKKVLILRLKINNDACLFQDWGFKYLLLYFFCKFRIKRSANYFQTSIKKWLCLVARTLKRLRLLC